MVWNVGWAASSSVAGLIIERFGFSMPFYITATLYATAAITFYRAFRGTREPGPPRCGSPRRRRACAGTARAPSSAFGPAGRGPRTRGSVRGRTCRKPQTAGMGSAPREAHDEQAHLVRVVRGRSLVRLESQGQYRRHPRGRDRRGQSRRCRDRARPHRCRCRHGGVRIRRGRQRAAAALARPFQGSFTATWNQRGRLGELNWTGSGLKPSGTTFVHRFEFKPDAKILTHSEPRPAR
jgi:hypothetical protein